LYSYIFGIFFFKEHLTLTGVLGSLLVALGECLENSSKHPRRQLPLWCAPPALVCVSEGRGMGCKRQPAYSDLLKGARKVGW
jgi:hypothetical protein